jgi:hypothetical protein
MRTHSAKFGLILLCPALVSLSACAGEPPADKKADPDPYALALRLDQYIEKQWEASKTVPAPRATDAEFMRRVYLDITGRIPHSGDVRKFLDDKDSDKRRKLVEKLLNTPLYETHFTNTWRAVMLPHSNDQQVQALAPQMEAWLRRRIRANVPYDQMVRDLLTANIGNGQMTRGPANPLDPNAQAFYQANENKPENLAAASSRLFLGIKLECAQCHNHPFAKWTREQFWEFASFYASIAPPQQQRGQPSQPMVQTRMELRELKIPNTEKIVKAKFLDGKEPEWKEDSISRVVLADWMTSPQNPYFARAMANRLWGHFFGIGIIDPVDDLGEDNPPSHPEMLDELGKAFADAKFDAKFLIKAITATRAYQTTSEVTHKSQEDPRQFARMALKGLSPEQLFDSLTVATGYKEQDGGRLARLGRVDNGSARSEFLTKFTNFSDRRTEYQTSILQALMLMNGRFVADADTVDLANEKAFGTLTAIYDSPLPSLATTKGKLNALHLATLAREMSPAEEERLVRYVEKGGPSGDSKKALADVFWALLNSSEFILNH